MDHLLLLLLLWSSGLRAEGRHNSTGDQCETIGKADIVLLVDGSGSIHHVDFHTILASVSIMVRQFIIGPDRVQIALVQYNNIIKTQWHLNTHQTKHSMLRAINEVQQLQGGTRTGNALNYILQNNFRTDVGMRTDSRKIVVLFTDGESQDDVYHPSQNLKNASIEIFAIGVKNAKERELRSIASDPVETHMYIISDFSFLFSIIDNFTINICDSINTLVSVRLVNGTSLCSGRLEVKLDQSDQSWSSVCEDGFDQEDAEVVCRELGCGAPWVLQGALYGEVEAVMWAREFQCEGNESAVLDCRSSDSDRSTCSPGKAVGLTCSDAFRLVGRASRCAGTLEVKQGDWRPVHGSDWTLDSAAVVCRDLDCGSVLSIGIRNASLKKSAWEISSDCVRSGYTLRECVSSGSSSSLLEITCSEPVRLVGGASRCSGSLTVKRGVWRPVYGVDWTLKSAAVACRQLDCGSVLSTGIRSESSHKSAWEISSDCVHAGSALRECVSPGSSSSMLEITCSVSVRLVNGTSLCSGRLEVKLDQSDQSWSSVCEDGFDQEDAEVVCRELGCGAPLVLRGALYGEVEAPVWTKEFQCEGNESAVLDCRSSDSDRSTCSPGKAVGLTCSDAVRLVGRASRCAGTLEVKQGDWRPVHGSDWTLDSAAMVCGEHDCGSAGFPRRREESSDRPAWKLNSLCYQSALRECVTSSSSSSVLEITCSDPAVFIIRLVLLIMTLLLFITIISGVHKASRGQRPGPRDSMELDSYKLDVGRAEEEGVRAAE